MAKFHINPKTGKPSKCGAHHKCPYGDLKTEHYHTQEAAREAYERSQAKDLVPSPMSHEPRDNWVDVDEKKEASIYSYYRRQLRGLRKSRTRSPAGEKKQRAREATAKNFSVPHSQVKSIVTQLQLEAGVPSVHDDPRHQRRVAYHTAGQALMDESRKDEKGNLICSCGSKDGVAVRPHPVEMEIHRRLQPVLLCRECYEVLAEDI